MPEEKSQKEDDRRGGGGGRGRGHQSIKLTHRPSYTVVSDEIVAGQDSLFELLNVETLWEAATDATDHHLFLFGRHCCPERRLENLVKEICVCVRVSVRETIGQVLPQTIVRRGLYIFGIFISKFNYRWPLLRS